MSTDFISAELVDYLNNELPAARRKEIEEILDSDPHRAKELEEFKQAQQAVRGLRVKNVSTDFNIKVQGRIQKKIEELRARGSTRFRTARERVEAARDGLSADEIKRRSGKAFKFGLLALLVTLPVLGVGLAGAFYYYGEQERLRKISERDREARLRGKAKHERRDARGASLSITVESGGTLSGLAFLGDKEVRLVPHNGREAGERCVFVYEPDQWRAYLAEIEKRRGLHGYQTLKAAAETARRVKVRGGRLLLPPGVYGGFLGTPDKVEVLRLRGRAEIWVSSDLEEYLTVKARLRVPKPKAKPAPGRMRWVPE
jgi:hypothetical protein